ncbi:VWA domain-containing protein [Niabella hibiscisoli]|uniref:VWA domain-containing protein n=1 Tax=Niabella hibiscisoli TaxID=1825928 RepID=UPI001F0EB030|nr:von Willebrand factor type A domain-containing protein [Niabella hibiscisoli]MCH5718151.1 von Willebrand factor type A domain-containing protein [Niabella hibiscisoli]
MKRFIFAIAILPWLGYACNQSYKNRTTEVAAETLADQAAPDESQAYFTVPESKDFSGEGYAHITENNFSTALDQPLSTFSVDVDKAAYSNIRRFLNNGQLPPAGAVRIEEMINYFDYDYRQPSGSDPFNVITEVASCPWNEKHQLVHIALKGKEMERQELPPSNLVFLIDVSGSMQDEDKLPLLKKSLLLLTKNLREDDNVSIVTYAGSAGLALPSTSGSDKGDIEDAIDDLEAGGSTAGGEGILLAYKVARQHFKRMVITALL